MTHSAINQSKTGVERRSSEGRSTSNVCIHIAPVNKGLASLASFAPMALLKSSELIQIGGVFLRYPYPHNELVVVVVVQK